MSETRPKRITVRCPECAWTGQRQATGGPCPRCATPVVDGRVSPPGRTTTRWTLVVDERARAQLSAREAARAVELAAGLGSS